MSALLCEAPKPQTSMISGFADPWEPAFMELNIPKTLKKHERQDGILFENSIFVNLEMFGHPVVYRFGRRGAPTNDEDPLKS